MPRLAIFPMLATSVVARRVYKPPPTRRQDRATLCLSLLDQSITQVGKNDIWKCYLDQDLMVIIGETSVQHTYQKLSIIQSVINSMKPFGSNTILVVVANPIDLFTSFIRDISGLPATRLIGSGTWLDSIRISNLLAEKAGVSAKY